VRNGGGRDGGIELDVWRVEGEGEGEVRGRREGRRGDGGRNLGGGGFRLLGGWKMRVVFEGREGAEGVVSV
jgi:hypothetical protein